MNNKEETLLPRIWDSVWSKLRLEEYTDVHKIDDLWTTFHLNILKRELSRVQAGGTFLEAGCGMGQWCFYAHRVGLRVTGVDIAPEIIAKIKAYIQGNPELRDMTFFVGDLTRSQLKSDFFDFIVSLGVIEHFHDSMPMLRELYRILKPGGRIFVSVPNLYAMHTLTRPLTQMSGVWKIGFEKSYTPASLRRDLQAAGFSVEELDILHSGHLFGRVLNSLPVVGSAVRALAHYIERKQSTFGLYIYAICRK